jgi:hypothetical protein
MRTRLLWKYGERESDGARVDMGDEREKSKLKGRAAGRRRCLPVEHHSLVGDRQAGYRNLVVGHRIPAVEELRMVIRSGGSVTQIFAKGVEGEGGERSRGGMDGVDRAAGGCVRSGGRKAR